MRFPLFIKTLLKIFLNDTSINSFTCNICGKKIKATFDNLIGRETISCYKCGSTLRFRSIINALSLRLFQDALTIPNFRLDKEIVGLGMSDAQIYAKPLSKKFNYINTFLHTEPKLDVANLDSKWFNYANFIISSEVLEHVNPPVNIAFNNLFKILKNDGIVVFSVPYKNEGNTVEHFPNLYNYKIEDINGRKKLHNITINGDSEIFDNLIWHGGPGNVLEMREFSEQDIMKELTDAGFNDIRIHDEEYAQFGIINVRKDSLIISMKKN